MSTLYPHIVNIALDLGIAKTTLNLVRESQMKRIAVKAELEITGSVSVPEIVRALSQANLPNGHPRIEKVEFASVSQTNTMRVHLVVQGDSYAKAEVVAENFLQSIDTYIGSLPQKDMTRPVDVHEGSMLLMPA